MRTRSPAAAVSSSSLTFVTSPEKRSTDSTRRWQVASTLELGKAVTLMLGNCVSCASGPTSRHDCSISIATPRSCNAATPNRAGPTGWALTGRIGAISAISGGNSNLDSITAVVIGGTSLFGGRGSIVGTLVGALVVGVFRNGLALAGADAPWQEFCVGLLIIVTVALAQWIRKVAA